jgi:hypothetical protein
MFKVYRMQTWDGIYHIIITYHGFPVICHTIQPYPIQRPPNNATSGTNDFAGGSIESGSENQLELERFKTLGCNIIQHNIIYSIPILLIAMVVGLDSF